MEWDWIGSCHNGHAAAFSFGMPSRKKYESRKETAAEGGIYYALSWIGLVFDGRVWLKQSGVAHFAGDLPEAEQKLIYATQGAPVADLFNQKVEGTAWKSRPTWYVLAREDQSSPGSATLCLKTHESYHDRSHGVPRPDVVEARRGTRCHP